MKSLKKNHIWIIGASSGIGASLAHGLALAGAKVVLTARRPEALEEIKLKLPGRGHLVMPLDVTKVDEVKYTLEKIFTHTQYLDRVIFLPAIYSPHSNERKSIDFIHEMISVNLSSAFTVVETVIPAFIKQGYGQIVLCGSVAGFRGLPRGQPYCATKAGIINYAESLKVELSQENIDVKVINPGFVKTPLTDKNNFTMPMMISAEKAACYIRKGLVKSAFEIHFPKRFTYIMKILKFLPYWLYFKLTHIMQNNMQEQDKNE